MESSANCIVVNPIKCYIEDVDTNCSSIEIANNSITINSKYQNVSKIRIDTTKDIEQASICIVLDDRHGHETNGFYIFINLLHGLSGTGFRSRSAGEHFKCVAIKTSLNSDILSIALSFQVKPTVIPAEVAVLMYNNVEGPHFRQVIVSPQDVNRDEGNVQKEKMEEETFDLPASKRIKSEPCPEQVCEDIDIPKPVVTVLNLMNTIRHKSMDRWTELCEALVGKVILSTVNNKRYKIVAIETKLNARSEFWTGDNYITFEWFYKSWYNINIANPGQPLLKVNLVDDEQQPPKFYFILPEHSILQ